jgi:DNA-binding GntR family transcriptional regulator
VPRMTDADLSGLDELADRMSELARQGAVAEFFTANAAFHERLCELSGNSKLLEVYHRLAGEVGRFQARTLALRGSLDGSVTEHRAILAAIRLRDADKAAELTAAHIRVPALRLNETSGADGQSLADLMPGTFTDTA